MHPAWQFSVSFTCAANGLIVDGRSLLENWLPNHIRVRYRLRKDICFSTYTMPLYSRILFLRKARFVRRNSCYHTEKPLLARDPAAHLAESGETALQTPQP